MPPEFSIFYHSVPAPDQTQVQPHFPFDSCSCPLQARHPFRVVDGILLQRDCLEPTSSCDVHSNEAKKCKHNVFLTCNGNLLYSLLNLANGLNFGDTCSSPRTATRGYDLLTILQPCNKPGKWPQLWGHLFLTTDSHPWL